MINSTGHKLPFYCMILVKYLVLKTELNCRAVIQHKHTIDRAVSANTKHEKRDWNKSLMAYKNVWVLLIHGTETMSSMAYHTC